MDPGAPSLAVCTGASGSRSALSFLICKTGVDNASCAAGLSHGGGAWPAGRFSDSLLLLLQLES